MFLISTLCNIQINDQVYNIVNLNNKPVCDYVSLIYDNIGAENITILQKLKIDVKCQLSFVSVFHQTTGLNNLNITGQYSMGLPTNRHNDNSSNEKNLIFSMFPSMKMQRVQNIYIDVDVDITNTQRAYVSTFFQIIPFNMTIINCNITMTLLTMNVDKQVIFAALFARLINYNESVITSFSRKLQNDQTINITNNHVSTTLLTDSRRYHFAGAISQIHNYNVYIHKISVSLLLLNRPYFQYQFILLYNRKTENIDKNVIQAFQNNNMLQQYKQMYYAYHTQLQVSQEKSYFSTFKDLYPNYQKLFTRLQFQRAFDQHSLINYSYEDERDINSFNYFKSIKYAEIKNQTCLKNQLLNFVNDQYIKELNNPKNESLEMCTSQDKIKAILNLTIDQQKILLKRIYGTRNIPQEYSEFVMNLDLNFYNTTTQEETLVADVVNYCIQCNLIIDASDVRSDLLVDRSYGYMIQNLSHYQTYSEILSDVLKKVALYEQKNERQRMITNQIYCTTIVFSREIDFLKCQDEDMANLTVRETHYVNVAVTHLINYEMWLANITTPEVESSDDESDEYKLKMKAVDKIKQKILELHPQDAFNQFFMLNNFINNSQMMDELFESVRQKYRIPEYCMNCVNRQHRSFIQISAENSFNQGYCRQDVQIVELNDYYDFYVGFYLQDYDQLTNDYYDEDELVYQYINLKSHEYAKNEPIGLANQFDFVKKINQYPLQQQRLYHDYFDRGRSVASSHILQARLRDNLITYDENNVDFINHHCKYRSFSKDPMKAIVNGPIEQFVEFYNSLLKDGKNIAKQKQDNMW